MLPIYRVRLSEDERSRLSHMISSGKSAASVLTHARILLKANTSALGPSLHDRPIADAVECGEVTVWRVRKAFVEEGLEQALYPKSKGHRPRKLDGDQEAQLVALACSKPPGERTVWTMQMLADRLVELKIIDSISDETVRVTLKKKRAEALAETTVGHPTRAKWRVRRGHGGRARSLQKTLRPAQASGMYGRSHKAAGG